MKIFFVYIFILQFLSMFIFSSSLEDIKSVQINEDNKADIVNSNTNTNYPEKSNNYKSISINQEINNSKPIE